MVSGEIAEYPGVSVEKFMVFPHEFHYPNLAIIAGVWYSP